MCRYSHQISFTSSARHALLRDGIDPFAAIRKPIESLGGRLIDAFFAHDSYDVLALSEFPESVAVDHISIAFYAGGAVAMIHSTPLLTASQAYESRHRAVARVHLVASNARAKSASAS
jgi:uncharacterized protein with GYD domain